MTPGRGMCVKYTQLASHDKRPMEQTSSGSGSCIMAAGTAATQLCCAVPRRGTSAARGDICDTRVCIDPMCVHKILSASFVKNIQIILRLARPVGRPCASSVQLPYQGYRYAATACPRRFHDSVRCMCFARHVYHPVHLPASFVVRSRLAGGCLDMTNDAGEDVSRCVHKDKAKSRLPSVREACAATLHELAEEDD